VKNWRKQSVRVILLLSISVLLILVLACGSTKPLVNMNEPEVLGVVGGDLKCKEIPKGAYVVTPLYILSCEEWYLDSIEREEDSQ
jgi:hypothetical protein